MVLTCCCCCAAFGASLTKSSSSSLYDPPTGRQTDRQTRQDKNGERERYPFQQKQQQQRDDEERKRKKAERCRRVASCLLLKTHLHRHFLTLCGLWKENNLPLPSSFSLPHPHFPSFKGKQIPLNNLSTCCDCEEARQVSSSSSSSSSSLSAATPEKQSENEEIVYRLSLCAVLCHCIAL